MVMGTATTVISNARTPQSFTDTILKWIFILIAVVVVAVIAFVVYIFFFSGIIEGIKDTNLSVFVPLLFGPVGGLASLFFRL